MGIPDLAPGAGGNVTIDVVLIEPIVGTVTYTNTATVSADGTDGDTTNNSASVSGSLTRILDIDITKTGSLEALSPGSTRIGSEVNYTITLTNNGDIPIVDGGLADVWPSADVTTPSFPSARNNIDLGTGQSITYMLSGELRDDVPVSFANTATFSYTVGNTGYSDQDAVTLQVPAPVCGNGIVENNEQCENVGGSIYAPSGVPVLSGQECVACQIRTTSVVNTAEMCIGN